MKEPNPANTDERIVERIKARQELIQRMLMAGTPLREIEQRLDRIDFETGIGLAAESSKLPQGELAIE